MVLITIALPILLIDLDNYYILKINKAKKKSPLYQIPDLFQIFPFLLPYFSFQNHLVLFYLVHINVYYIFCQVLYLLNM